MSKINTLKLLLETEITVTEESNDKDIIDIIAEIKEVDPELIREGQSVEMEHAETLKALYELANDRIAIESFVEQGSAMISADHVKELGAKYYPELKIMEDKIKKEVK